MRSFLRVVGRNERGSITVIAAFSIVLVLLVSGGAVDFSRANEERTKLQHSLDAAALAVAKAGLSDDSKISQNLNDYMAAVMDRHKNLKNLKVEYEVEDGEDAQKLKLWAEGKMTNTLLAVVWRDKMDVSVYSEVSFGLDKDLEIVLVLDNTGSMGGQKIKILKEASTNFVESFIDIKKQFPKSDIKIGLVPFDVHVKVNPSIGNKGWSKFNDEDHKTKWGGCLWDREKGLDAKVEYNGTEKQKFPASDNGWYTSRNCGLAQLKPLTDKLTTLKGPINSMKASGMTNIGLGLTWGWNLLDNQEPFTEGVDNDDEKTKKIIILLTDGDNTFNRRNWEGKGGINSQTQEACDNLKSTNIEVYTIRVVNGNKSLLENCATKKEYFYDVKKPEQMITVFDQIAKNIQSLHLSY